MRTLISGRDSWRQAMQMSGAKLPHLGPGSNFFQNVMSLYILYEFQALTL